MNLADELERRIDTAWHERSIWNYGAAKDAEKELARFMAEHRDAILAALRSEPDAAEVERVWAALAARCAADPVGAKRLVLVTPDDLRAALTAARSRPLTETVAACRALPWPGDGHD